jgi:hypothetical protein
MHRSIVDTKVLCVPVIASLGATIDIASVWLAATAFAYAPLVVA